MYEAIAANRRRTAVLVVVAIALLGVVGYALGYVYSTGPAGMVFALGFAAIASWGSYRYGDRVVLASTRAREVTPADAPRLHNIVEGLAIAAGLGGFLVEHLFQVGHAAQISFCRGQQAVIDLCCSVGFMGLEQGQHLLAGAEVFLAGTTNRFQGLATAAGEGAVGQLLLQHADLGAGGLHLGRQVGVQLRVVVGLGQ